jgi:5-oxoprolinase (ATP-hydrolysing)
MGRTADNQWRVFVDTGGTFTDGLAVSPDGRRSKIKILSSDHAPELSARLLTGTPDDQPLPPVQMRLGTTRGTNALLEEQGAEVVFFVTKGFGDLLRIGDQRRPDLFALRVEKPQPLHAYVVEVPGRLDAEGNEISPLQLNDIFDSAKEHLANSRTVAAVALLHSHRNAAHEAELKNHLVDLGFEYVACSAELASFIKVVPRAETAVVDAYLGPLMAEYLDRVKSSLGGGRLRVMTSAGGLVSRENYRAKDSLLSGPAGGVVGAAAVARRAGLGKIIAFDMGGTSTDVSRFDGDFNYCETHAVGRAQLMAPALKIETVAAGGGSICGLEGGLLLVGPKSAGAKPGPACYGAGGPLTITDVNLLLGRLDLETFNLPVHSDAAEAAFYDVRQTHGGTREEILQGFLSITDERMANAIRKISVREGYDPADHALVAFGGAGGQHACGVAERLGILRILFPADAGLLSAFGLERARVERIAEAQVLKTWAGVGDQLSVISDQLESRAVAELMEEGVESVVIRRRTALARFAGQESVLAVDFDEVDEVPGSFRERYRETFGYLPAEGELELVSLRVIASTSDEPFLGETFNEGNAPEAARTVNSFFNDEWREAPVFAREAIKTGAVIMGPAIVSDAFGTLVIDPGWRGMVGSEASLLLEQTANRKLKTEKPEFAERELFTNRFTSIVEEMGAQLKRTAISTNIKERLDFSCALLDAEGRLIINAPHIPVHLGALGLCVREVAARLKLEPGDVVVTNHPACGGSHLPDVTLIAPVFDKTGVLLGYVANRAHHAEIGGIAPGSMSPAAKSLVEEGVVIAPMHLFKKGEASWAEMTACLREAPFPTRRLEENLADLQAQVAAIRLGESALHQMASAFGADKLREQMVLIHNQAARAIRSKLVDWAGSDLRATQRLDNGAELVVRIRVNNDAMEIDFTGTSPVVDGNLNATPAIVRSVLVYVLRLLVDEEMPLNEGLLEPVRVILPECLLNPDFGGDDSSAPAVFGGNVEVSQRLVDTLLLAFEAAACSQGTMNNFVMGDATRSYYETIGGGTGAGDGFPGTSGVHVHMSNTAITDPEILEWRFPVRLHRFALRAGSGGTGQWNGGDGLVREIEFLEPQTVSLLGQHRTEGPFGLAGGSMGKCGRQTVIRSDGAVEEQKFAAQLVMQSGDRLVIETPGGGGYG